MTRLLMCATVLLSHSAAFAFGGPLHIKITMRALKPLGFSKAVAKEIGVANDFIDHEEALNSATHVDSESFEAASALMKKRLQLSAQLLIVGDVKKARETFGYVTHTAQDFYSHSNYVEFMMGKPIDLLSLKNPSPDLKCSKWHKRNGLTTGYFPDNTTPPGKCSHGVLNKDGGMIYIPHYIAAYYAKKETARMYGRLKNEVHVLTGNEAQTTALMNSFKKN